MQVSAGRAVLVFAFALSLAGCSSSGVTSVDGATAPPTAGSGGGNPGTGGAPGTGTGGNPAAGPPDAGGVSAKPTDCRSLLVCVDSCRADAACAGRCIAAAPADAQALYKKIHDCSLKACPDQTMTDCRCENECYGGGECTDLVDECDMSTPDFFCDPGGTICGI
jgi:hypothetical protein